MTIHEYEIYEYIFSNVELNNYCECGYRMIINRFIVNYKAAHITSFNRRSYLELYSDEFINKILSVRLEDIENILSIKLEYLNDLNSV